MIHKTLLWLVSLASLSSQAVITRHDVDPNTYIIDTEHLPSLVTLYQHGVHGVLIHPKWVLTAQHASNCMTKGSKIRIADKLLEVSGLFLHPDHQEQDDYDIALLQLTKPVLHAKPMRLNPSRQENNRHIWFAGAGLTGTGLSGNIEKSRSSPHILRHAQNKVTRADGPNLYVMFDQGEAALPLEGLAGYYDSGGPVYYDNNGEQILFGIISRSEGLDALIGKYGIHDVAVRVSYFKSWIDNVVASSPEDLPHIALAIPPIPTGNPMFKSCQKSAL